MLQRWQRKHKPLQSSCLPWQRSELFMFMLHLCLPIPAMASDEAKRGWINPVRHFFSELAGPDTSGVPYSYIRSSLIDFVSHVTRPSPLFGVRSSRSNQVQCSFSCDFSCFSQASLVGLKSLLPGQLSQLVLASQRPDLRIFRPP